MTDPALRLLLFGGKGGTGKTTMAAATAIHLARSRPASRILVASTDPAHSLADSLGWGTSEPRVSPPGEAPAVPGFSNLWCLEMDAAALMQDFRERHRRVMGLLAERGTYLDRAEIEELLTLPLPGAQEVMAVLQIADLLKARSYDLILLDTAPTGHTLRLLSLPQSLRQWMGIFELMQAKHRYLVRKLTRRYREDEADRFLETLAGQLSRTEKVLRDPQATEFVVVTVPEPVILAETERLVKALERHRVPVHSLVVNRVEQPSECEQCGRLARLQEPWLLEIRRRFAGCRILPVPRFPRPVRGPDDLAVVASHLFGRPVPLPLGEPQPEPRIEPAGGLESSWLLDRELVLLVGKGGVGKTTLAAAAAYHLAGLAPDRAVLVCSIDPAHSLSDVLDQPVGGRPVPVLTPPGSSAAYPNLRALELDASQSLAALEGEMRAALDRWVAEESAQGREIRFDHDILARMLELSPPGLDEIMAVKEIFDLRRGGPDELIVVDTAPTGHLLSFLEMPEMAERWLGFLLRVLARYQVSRTRELFERVLELRGQIRKLELALKDPARSAFVAVTVAEAMSVLELERLLRALSTAGAPCRQVVFNMVIQAPPSGTRKRVPARGETQAGCSRCRTRFLNQQGHIADFRRRFGGEMQVCVMPLLSEEVRGGPILERVGRRLLPVAQVGAPGP